MVGRKGNSHFWQSLASQKGSAAIIAILSIGIGIAAGVATLGAGEFAKKQNAIKRGAKGLATNQYFLNLLAERFRYTDTYQPTWFLEPYPTGSDMALGRTPHVRVLDPSTSGTTMVPTIQGSSNYQVDKTGMGSILFPPSGAPLVDSSGNTVTAQTAYLAAGDMSQLTNQWTSFFTSPTGAWPSDGSRFTSTEIAAMSFVSVTPDSTYTTWAKELVVEITTGSGKAAVRNTAKIALDAPKAPTCQIQLAPGQTLPLQRGATATFNLMSDSIVRGAEISTDDWASRHIFNQNDIPNQSIRNVGKWTPFKTVSYTVPAQPKPGYQMNLNGAKGMAWALRMWVAGVADPSAAYCELNIPVQIPPPPVCFLWAVPPNPNYGAWTTMNLYCLNEVTSAWINGTQVWLNPANPWNTLGVQKLTWDTQWVSGSAVGPGGAAVVWASLGPNCRWNNPDYIENINMPWAEWRLFSHGPARTHASTWKWQKLTATYYGTPTWEGGTPCNGNELCLFNMAVNQFDNGAFTGAAFLGYSPADSASCGLTRTFFRYPGDGCFIQGTGIEKADHTWVAIESLKIGDLLWNPIKKESTRIIRITAGPEKERLWTVKSTGGTLRVTRDHPFLTQRGLLPVQALRRGDRLLGETEPVILIDVFREKNTPTEWVWNVELDGDSDKDHIINANGIPSGELWLQRKVKQQNTGFSK